MYSLDIEDHTMDAVTTIKLHALYLFNISDHITRDIPSSFGIILGARNSSTIEISNSFEILFNDSLSIDFDYLFKKLEQFKTVLPHLSLMGIYHISDTVKPDNETFSIIDQLQKFKDKYDWENRFPIAYIMSNPANLSFGYDNSTSKSFQSYIYPNNTILATNILANQTELIASTTISKNQKYSSAEKDVTCKSFDSLLKEDISSSVNSLYSKVSNIVEYLEMGKISELNITIQIEIENQIAYLANKITSYLSGNISKSSLYKHELETSHLALLTDQLTALTNLNNELVRITCKQNFSNPTL